MTFQARHPLSSIGLGSGNAEDHHFHRITARWTRRTRGCSLPRRGMSGYRGDATGPDGARLPTCHHCRKPRARESARLPPRQTSCVRTSIDPLLTSLSSTNDSDCCNNSSLWFTRCATVCQAAPRQFRRRSSPITQHASAWSPCHRCDVQVVVGRRPCDDLSMRIGAPIPRRTMPAGSRSSQRRTGRYEPGARRTFAQADLQSSVDRQL